MDNPARYVFFGIEIPDDTMETITAYVETGRPTGQFLAAVINNDLREAINRADEHNLKALPAIVAYFHNRTPAGCWGLSNSYEGWIELKRREREARSCEQVGASE